MFPFAIEYPKEQQLGYWGQVTSTIDWCEENYVVSNYIAEFLNTLTNAGFIALAGFAIYQVKKNNLEPRFVFTALGFLLVGVGSWLFHMTLKYHFQLLDELPMIYATCIPFWSVFSEFRSPKDSVLIGIGIFMAANLLTMIYLYVKDPTLHQAAYGILNFFIIFKSYRLTDTYVKDKKAKSDLNKTMALGVGLFIFGYFLWNLDIHLCTSVRALRRQIGMPYGFVLEGHGWWHIFTGLGVYFYLVYEEYLRCFLTNTDKFFAFRWTCLGLPVVTCIDFEGLERFRAEQKGKKQL
jgi:dihydroceramidase